MKKSQRAQQCHRQDRSISRSLSQKCIYIAEETNKKEVSTIFHSPLKNGRPNPNYQNPSFMSSNLFYPNVDQSPLKKGILPNRNDISRRKLYDKRMQRSTSEIVLHQKANRQGNEKPKDFGPRIRNKMQSGSHSEQLKQELNTLVCYREAEKKNCYQQPFFSSKQDHSFGRKQPEIPSYFNRRRLEKEEEVGEKQRQELHDWVDLTNQISSVKNKQKREEAKQQNRKMTYKVNQYSEMIKMKERQSRENATLLNLILKEQIHQKRKDGQNKKILVGNCHFL